jgi:hypothetical protein
MPRQESKLFNFTVQGRLLLLLLETSALTENKRMTNHNTPQLSRMDLPNHCAAIPGLSPLSTRAVFMTTILSSSDTAPLNSLSYSAVLQLRLLTYCPEAICLHLEPGLTDLFSAVAQNSAAVWAWGA